MPKFAPPVIGSCSSSSRQCKRFLSAWSRVISLHSRFRLHLLNLLSRPKIDDLGIANTVWDDGNCSMGVGEKITNNKPVMRQDVTHPIFCSSNWIFICSLFTFPKKSRWKQTLICHHRVIWFTCTTMYWQNGYKDDILFERYVFFNITFTSLDVSLSKFDLDGLIRKKIVQRRPDHHSSSPNRNTTKSIKNQWTSQYPWTTCFIV